MLLFYNFVAAIGSVKNFCTRQMPMPKKKNKENRHSIIERLVKLSCSSSFYCFAENTFGVSLGVKISTMTGILSPNFLRKDMKKSHLGDESCHSAESYLKAAWVRGHRTKATRPPTIY